MSIVTTGDEMAAAPFDIRSPSCPSCGGVTAVRVQLPMWLTLLVAPDDARHLLVFECGDPGCGDSVAKLRADTAGPSTPSVPPRVEAVVGPGRDPAPRCGEGHRLRTAVRLVDRRRGRPAETRVQVCLRCDLATIERAPAPRLDDG